MKKSIREKVYKKFDGHYYFQTYWRCKNEEINKRSCLS